MATAWLDERRPGLVFLARGVGRPLWLAIRGVAGHLPFLPEEAPDKDLTASLTREAKNFQRDRR